MVECLEKLEILKETLSEMHPVNRSAVNSYHQLLQPLHMLEPDRVRELTESSPYFPRAVVERPIKGFSTLAEQPSAKLLYLYPLLELRDSVGPSEGRKQGRALGSAKLEFSLPTFDSDNLGGWAKEFARVLRITGQAQLSHQELSDAILVSMKTAEIKEHFEGRLRECSTLKEFLLEIEALFPKFECDAEIRNQIKALKPIQNLPNLTQLAIFQARLRNLLVRLTPDSYSRHEYMEWVYSKIPEATMSDLKQIPEGRGVIHDPVTLFKYLELRAFQRLESVAHKRLFGEAGGKKHQGFVAKTTKEFKGKTPTGNISISCSHCGKSGHLIHKCWAKEFESLPAGVDRTEFLEKKKAQAAAARKEKWIASKAKQAGSEKAKVQPPQQNKEKERITDHFPVVRKDLPATGNDESSAKKRKLHFAEKLVSSLEEGISAGAVDNQDVEALERFMFQQRRDKMSGERGIRKGKGNVKGQINQK